MVTFWFVPLCLSLAVGQLTSTIVKIVSHGGDCDHSSTQSPNHYSQWGWEFIGQGALGSDRRDGASNFASFHAPISSSSSLCRNNNWFRMDEQSPGVYKIVSHGGDCNTPNHSPNNYGMYGWELIGQHALSSDRRDSASNFASFHVPISSSSPLCRNNNHFVIVPVDTYGQPIGQMTIQLNSLNTTGDIQDHPTSMKSHDAAFPQVSEQLASHNSKTLQVATVSMIVAAFIASIAVGVVLWQPRHRPSSGLPLLGAEA